MTTTGLSVSSVFADAERMHDAALQRLAADDIRDAAEKAWCAAKRATDALVLARTGKLPPKSPDTSRALRTMAAAEPAIRGLAKPLLHAAGSAARRLLLHRPLRSP